MHDSSRRSRCSGGDDGTAEEAPVAAQPPAEAPPPAAEPPAEAEAPATQASPQIAFTSDRDGDEEIYVMNADGSGLRQLTQNEEPDAEPTWSPDGQQLAFSRGLGIRRGHLRDERRRHLRAPADLTEGQDDEPAWSPTGARSRPRASAIGVREIYVMNADGTDQRRLTDDLGVYGGKASWSPDGSRSSTRPTSAGDGGIFVDER